MRDLTKVAIRVGSAAEARATIDFLKRYGDASFDEENFVYWKEYPDIRIVVDHVLHRKIVKLYRLGSHTPNVYPFYKIPQLLIDTEPIEVTPINIKLTDDYVAIVNNSGIRVGCTNITFETFAKLKGAVEQVQAELKKALDDRN